MTTAITHNGNDNGNDGGNDSGNDSGNHNDGARRAAAIGTGWVRQCEVGNSGHNARLRGVRVGRKGA